MAKSTKTLRKNLWKLTSEYVRRRYADCEVAECVTCGLRKHWKELQAGHFIPQAQGNAVKYDLRNIHVQCYRCNINLGSNGPEYYPFMIKTYGQETIDELKRLSNTTIKLRASDYELMIKDIEQKLNKL